MNVIVVRPQPVNRDPVRRLDDFIQSCLPHRFAGRDVLAEYVQPARAVTREEAGAFFRAVDSGLFELQPDGYCKPHGFRPYGCVQLLDPVAKGSNQVRLFREWLTHAAILAELVLDYHYDPDDIAIEVGAFDGLVYSRSNRPFIAVEAKSTEAELKAMLHEMCDLQAGVPDLPCGVHPSNAGKKFRSLLALRPRLFLAAAPGIRRAFAVDYINNTARLQPKRGIPPSRPRAETIRAAAR